MTTLNLSTNYRIATSWLNNSFILCNDVCKIDPSVYDNARFDLDTDIFQWYLTDCSESEVEFLEEHFGLLFTFSDTLDLYILAVDHFGTSWDYVYCDTDLDVAVRKLGESK